MNILVNLGSLIKKVARKANPFSRHYITDIEADFYVFTDDPTNIIVEHVKNLDDDAVTPPQVRRLARNHKTACLIDTFLRFINNLNNTIMAWFSTYKKRIIPRFVVLQYNPLCIHKCHI